MKFGNILTLSSNLDMMEGHHTLLVRQLKYKRPLFILPENSLNLV